MPGIQDPAMGSGASFPVGGPGGPGSATPIKNEPKPGESEKSKHGFLGNRRISLPPQGPARELLQKAHPVAADQMPKQPKPEAASAKQPANVNVLSRQHDPSGAGNSRKAVIGVFNQQQPVISQLGADLQKALSPNGQAELPEPKVVNGIKPSAPDQEGGIPAREPQQASAPPKEVEGALGPDGEISPEERAAIYERVELEGRNAEMPALEPDDEQPGAAPNGVPARASAPDLADLQPGSPIGGAPAGDDLPPASESLDDLFTGLDEDPTIATGIAIKLDNASLSTAQVITNLSSSASPLEGEVAAQLPDADRPNIGNQSTPKGLPIRMGHAAGIQESNAFSKARESANAIRAKQPLGRELISQISKQPLNKELISEIYSALNSIYVANLFKLQEPARAIDHNTQPNRADLQQQVHVFPDHRRLHVFQALNHGQYQALKQQYPGYDIVEIPEEFHDHVFEAIQSHIDGKKQEYEKKQQEKRATHQSSTGARTANSTNAATSEDIQRTEDMRALLQENDEKSASLRNLLNMLMRRGTQEHAKEARERYEKLEERMIAAKELLREILKSEIKTEELKKAEVTIFALNSDLKREEEKLLAILNRR